MRDAVAHRSVLGLNELLAAEGLVRRSSKGYDPACSKAFYHPADCGLVVTTPGADREAARTGLRRTLARARDEHRVGIGLREVGMKGPNLAFLFPTGDAYFTGDPPSASGKVLDSDNHGGHHLSPLSPTPWIKAMLGLWTPRTGIRFGDMPGIPVANRGLRTFLRGLRGEG